MTSTTGFGCLVAVLALGTQACGGSDDSDGGSGTNPGDIINPLANPESGPPAGWAEGKCSLGVPNEALPEDVSSPDHVIGDGTAASCTSDAVVQTIALGGVITFNCGPDPVVIKLAETAKIVNDTGPKIVIDGGVRSSSAATASTASCT